MSNINLCSNSLNTWYQQPLGRELATLETAQLQAVLANLPGQYLLQMGTAPLLDQVKTYRIMHRIMIAEESEKPTTRPAIHSAYTELPLLNDCMDCVVLPHVLEIAGTNKQALLLILNEAWRVLAPDGHLIILGFNPWSLWGLWRLFNQNDPSPPWNHYFHSPTKLRHYIDQLNGEIITVKYIFFRPPINQQTLLTRSRWIDKTIQLLLPSVGGVYLLIAKKTTMACTPPIKPRWSWRDLLATPKLEPSIRGVRRG